MNMNQVDTYPELSSLDSSVKLQERYIRSHYADFYEMLNNTYTWCSSFIEKMYAYFHHLDSSPVCPVCGSKVSFISLKQGYRTYCSKQCMGRSDTVGKKKAATLKKHYGDSFGEHLRDKVRERYGVDNIFQLDSVKEKIKATNIERYGVEHLMKRDGEYERRSPKRKETLIERYGVDNAAKSDICKQRMRDTCMERYGHPCSLQNDDVDRKTRNTNMLRYGDERFTRTQLFLDKQAETCQRRYNADSFVETEGFRDRAKNSCIERYGIANYTQSDEYKARHDEIQAKSYDTKKRNRSFNTSRIEDQVSAYLTSHDIHFIPQYKSDLYPYSCDFYLTDYDTYVEIQGSWTHGGHPFDVNNELDVAMLDKWRNKKTAYYDNAIDTWTVRDTAKRQCAQRNNLKYIEIFSSDINEAAHMIEQHINDNKNN